MIVKAKKKVHRDDILSVIHIGHKAKEITRFKRAFHSMCKHIKLEQRIGSAAIEFGPNVSRSGRKMIKV